MHGKKRINKLNEIACQEDDLINEDDSDEEETFPFLLHHESGDEAPCSSKTFIDF